VSKLKQIDKLLKVKELRRRLAEMEAAKASREMHMANQAVEDAKQEQIHIKETAGVRRKERLQNIIEPGQNPSIQNARIVNVYAITDQEIQESAFNTEIKQQKLSESEDRLKLEQSKLARFLQLEERTRKLCDKLIDMKKVEAARQE